MKRIALIHTVKSVLDSFEPLLRAAVGQDALIHNLLDDFLATDPARTGVFSDTNERRLRNDILNAELTGADLIIVTCSTLTPAVGRIRPTVGVPLLAIDDELCRRAVRRGPKIAVLATAKSTVEPTRRKVQAEGEAAGLPADIRVFLNEEAIAALRAGDAARHDALVCETARNAKGSDTVVLAQASMAHLEAEVARICACPTLSSPSLCIEEALRMLKRTKG